MSNKIIFAILIFLLARCSSSLEIKDGDTAYSLKRYALAAELLQDKFEKAKSTQNQYDYALKIIHAYNEYGAYEKAIDWYQKALALKEEEDLQIEYCKALMRNEAYEKAKIALEGLISNDRGLARLLKEWVDLCEIAIENKDQDLIEITNLRTVNTPMADYGFIIHKDRFYISSSNNDESKDFWTNEGYQNILSGKVKGKTHFSAPQLWNNDINSEFHDGALTFNKKGNEVYFTRCGMNDDDNDACKIYFSYKMEDDIWSDPERVYFFDDSVNVGQPFLSGDEKTLYFASDIDYGYGGKDLYYSKRIGENWDEPINLGPRINTTGDEMFPHIDKDGNLLFASDGYAGFGGLDIFSANKVGKVFRNTTNLGYGINSGGDDFAMWTIPSEEDSILIEGYISSSRKNGVGRDDIYYIKKKLPKYIPPPPPYFVFKGIIKGYTYKDEKNPNSKKTGSKSIQKATVVINERFGDKTFEINSLKTNDEGIVNAPISMDTDYLINVGKEGYFSKVTSFSSKKKNANPGDTIVIEKTIVLDKIFEEVEIVIKNIYYDLDKWNIREDAQPILDSLSTILINNPSIRVELGSHTDARGKDQYNQNLSQKRAQAAVDYLILKGINNNRLIAKGYGESKLVNECANGISCTEEKHQQNRRTTFKILSSK